MEKIKFDVMLKDKFICTMSYEYLPLLPVHDYQIREYIEKKRPTLKGKPYHVEFYTKDNKTQQPKNFITAAL